MPSFINIELSNIKHLIGVLENYTSVQIVKNQYRGSRFEETRAFLEDIGLIEVYQNSSIRLTGQRLDNRTILKYIYKNEGVIGETFRHYCRQFTRDEEGGYKARLLPGPEYRAVNILLLEMKIIFPDTSRFVRIYKRNHATMEAIWAKRSQSPAQLKRHMKNQEAIGLKAEERIMEYERERLMERPDLVATVDHIAKRDVLAGYDIRSWEAVSDGAIPRYIEVKAVSSDDYKFYWSNNEIETATREKDQYYLYLLPVISDGFNMGQLKCIQNPVKSVFQSKQWDKAIDGYVVSKSQSVEKS